MGLLDFLIELFSGSERIQCPSCGAEGARRTKDRLIACKNPSCPYFVSPGKARHADTTVPTTGNFRPERPISIRYRNFAGQDRDFSAELGSIYRKNNHLVARVAPMGRKIALSRERIQNLTEVEAAMPQRVAQGQGWPTARERQILGYHKKHGSTSPRYEQVWAKYPNW